MALIYQNNSLGKDVPQTHALVIGVNHYSYLRGGKEYNQGRRAKYQLELNHPQLSSPVPSAIAFTEWLLDDYNNVDAPLATVELLISPMEEALSYVPRPGKTYEVERATRSTIQRKFEDWFNKCHLSEKNVAILYFCGHGVSDEAYPLLLPEDYGSSEFLPFDEIIDFPTTYTSMATCKAGIQIFFLDACRTKIYNKDLLSNFDKVRPLRYLGRAQEQYPRSAPVLMGATRGEGAKGGRGEISYFTMATIDSLKRFAADANESDFDKRIYKVTPQSIKKTIPYRMRWVGELIGDAGGEITEDVIREFHILRGQAETMLSIDCKLPEALAQGHINLKGVNGKEYVSLPMGGSRVRKMEIEPGYYKIETDLLDSKFRASSKEAYIITPYTKVNIEVENRQSI